MGPSTPTRRTKSKRKLPSLAEGGHARVPDSVEVLSSQLLCQSPQLLYQFAQLLCLSPCALPAQQRCASHDTTQLNHTGWVVCLVLS